MIPSRWQRGCIAHYGTPSFNFLYVSRAEETVNGLIRQYIPKNTSFPDISHQEITKIMHKINTIPREKLNFSTPRECFYEKIS